MRKYNHKLIKNNAYQAEKIDILIRAADLADTPKDLLFSKEPTRLEDLGLTIRTIRKKNSFDIQNLALKSRCSPEIIIALEMGVLPVKEIGLYLPGILRGLGLDQNFFIELLQYLKEEK
jgi:hypothetical protein